MILIDQILSYDTTTLEAALTITPESQFYGPKGVPSHVGIEYMAQACGAHAGALARDANLPVKIGFLLGSRRYEAYLPWFHQGDRLFIHVTVEYRDEKMGSYQCAIRIADRLAAEARLSFYQPDSAELFAADQGAWS